MSVSRMMQKHLLICLLSGAVTHGLSTDLFMTNRTNGVATYRNTDFFGMVEGLNFALQYQGKNEGTGNYKANGNGHGLSATYTIDSFFICWCLCKL